MDNLATCRCSLPTSSQRNEEKCEKKKFTGQRASGRERRGGVRESQIFYDDFNGRVHKEETVGYGSVRRYRILNDKYLHMLISFFYFHSSDRMLTLGM